jgi:signal transduction histidine kinase
MFNHFQNTSIKALICLTLLFISCRNKQTNNSEADMKTQAAAWYKTATNFQKTNEDSCFYYFEKVLDLTDKIEKDTLRPYILFKIAMLHYRAFNYNEAIKLSDSAMNTARRSGNFVIVANCLNELGTLESDLNNPDEARSYFNKALQIASQNHLGLQTGVALGNIANLETNPDSAISYMEHAISILKNVKGAGLEYSTILANLANSMPYGDHTISLFSEAIEVAEKGNYTEVLMGAYNNLACTYLDHNQAGKAEECLRDHAIPVALKSSNTDWLSTLYETFAEVFEKKGDFRQAYDYQKQAMKSRTEALVQQSAAQNRLLNALLRARNREIEIRTKHDELNRSYLLLAFLSIAIIFILMISFILIQRKNLKLRKKEIEMAKRLNAIEEKEQERLSMQLHDAIRPLSAVVMRQIESMEFPSMRMKDEMMARLSETTQQLRQISHRLNPVIRNQMTFTELVRSIRDDFKGRSGLTMKLDLPEKDPVLPGDTLNQLYFIIQELMMNAAKHVVNGTVHISISKELGNLFIFYEDDGAGFDPSKVELSGLGLMHIFERAKLANGKATLDTKPGEGTKWTITIPL